MKTIKTVVIDDELSNRELLIGLLNKLNPNFTLEGEASNIKEGHALIQLVKPDVVFLDIKMNGGSGFELLELYNEIFFEIVFISAFDNYALRAFEFNALDYILKPINPDKLDKTLLKLQSRIQTKELQRGNLKTVFGSYDNTHTTISKIPIHIGKSVKLLNIEEVVCVKSHNGCVLFVLKSKETFSSAKQLGDYDFIFEQHPYLLKINKSTFVNVQHVKSYSKGVNCELTLTNDLIFEISRRKKAEVLAKLKSVFRINEIIKE